MKKPNRVLATLFGSSAVLAVTSVTLTEGRRPATTMDTAATSEAGMNNEPIEAALNDLRYTNS
jgi:hypothetical protein